MAARILVVDDDKTLLEVLSYNLTKEGYSVLTAPDGTKALELVRGQPVDLIILDIMLPGLDGFELCRIWRKELSVPILILSAKVEEVDRIVGLELGADDYMTKPFSMRELVARVKSILRRCRAPRQETPETAVWQVGDLEVNPARHEARLGGSVLDLTPKEFDLLKLLLQNKGLVMSRDTILEKVWGYDYVGEHRTVDVHIQNLRQKIEKDPRIPRRITTVRGVGYRLEDRDVSPKGSDRPEATGTPSHDTGSRP